MTDNNFQTLLNEMINVANSKSNQLNTLQTQTQQPYTINNDIAVNNKETTNQEKTRTSTDNTSISNITQLDMSNKMSSLISENTAALKQFGVLIDSLTIELQNWDAAQLNQIKSLSSELLKNIRNFTQIDTSTTNTSGALKYITSGGTETKELNTVETKTIHTSEKVNESINNSKNTPITNTTDTNTSTSINFKYVPKEDSASLPQDEPKKSSGIFSNVKDFLLETAVDVAKDIVVDKTKSIIVDKFTKYFGKNATPTAGKAATTAAKSVVTTAEAATTAEAVTVAESATAGGITEGATLLSGLGPFFGYLMLALTTGAVGYATYKGAKYQKELPIKAEKARTETKEANDDLSTIRTVLDEFIPDYARLSKGVDEKGKNISLSTEDYAHYTNIVKYLGTTFPQLTSGTNSDGTPIIKNKVSLADIENAYNEKAQDTRDTNIRNSKDSLDYYQNEVTNNFGGLVRGKGYIEELIQNSTQGPEVFNNFFDTLWQRSDMETYFKTSFPSVGLDWNEMNKGPDLLYEAINANLPKIRNLESNLDEQIATETNNIKPGVQARVQNDSSYQSLDTKSQSIVDQIMASLDDAFYQSGNLDDMANYIKNNIVDKFKGSDGSKNEKLFNDAFNLKNQYDNGNISLKEYQTGILDFTKQISSFDENVKKSMDGILALQSTSGDKNVKDFNLDDINLYSTSAVDKQIELMKAAKLPTDDLENLRKAMQANLLTSSNQILDLNAQVPVQYKPEQYKNLPYTYGDYIMDVKKDTETKINTPKNANTTTGPNSAPATAPTTTPTTSTEKNTNKSTQTTTTKVTSTSNTAAPKSLANSLMTAGEATKETFQKLYDWIEIKLKRIKEQTKGFLTAANNAFKDSDKKKEYRRAISSTSNEITSNEKASKAYMEKAESIGLPDEYKSKIQNGEMSVETVTDKALSKQIDEYQEYYDKAIACKSAISELRAEMVKYAESLYKVPIERATKNIQKLSTALSVLQAQYKALTTASAKNSNLSEQTANLKKQTDEKTKADRTATKAMDAYTDKDEKAAYIKASNAAKAAPAIKAKISSKYKKKSRTNEDGTLSTKGVKGNQKKLINQYNTLVKAEKDAQKKYYDASFSDEQKAYDKAKRKTENAKAKINSKYLKKKDKNGYISTDGVSNKKQLKQINSYNDLLKKEKNAKAKLNKAKKNAGALLDANNGKEIDTSNLKGKELEAAVKYNAALAAQKEASEAASIATAEYTQTARENGQAKLDNIKTEYDSVLALKNANVDKAKAKMSLKEAQGKSVSEEDYNTILSDSNSIVQKSKEEYDSYVAQYNQNLADGVYNNDAAGQQKALSEIENLETAWYSAQTSVANYINEQKQINIDNLQNQLDILSKISDKYESLLKLRKAQGADTTDDEITQQLENNNNELAKKLNLLSEYQSRLATAEVNGSDADIDKYKKEILGLETSILELKTSNEGLNDNFIDVRIKALNDEKEALQKLNNVHDRKLALEKAEMDLEKASQRTNLVYDGTQLVYQRDETNYKNAQEALEKLKFDEVINSIDDSISDLEDLKDKTNLYDKDGNKLDQSTVISTTTSKADEIVKKNLDLIASNNLNTSTDKNSTVILSNSGVQLTSASNLSNLAIASNTLTNLPNAQPNGILSNTNPALPTTFSNNLTGKNISISIGDIVLNDVQDVNGLSNAIVQNFSTRLTQELNKI